MEIHGFAYAMREKVREFEKFVRQDMLDVPEDYDPMPSGQEWQDRFFDWLEA